MIYRVIVLAFILFSQHLFLDARSWTNSKGQHFQGECIGFSKGKVKIRRKADGRIFDVPIKSLSESDQKYIERWVAENPHRVAQLGLVAEPKFKNRKQAGSGKSYDGYYEISVKNESGTDEQEGIEIQYLMKVQREGISLKKSKSKSKRVDYDTFYQTFVTIFKTMQRVDKGVESKHGTLSIAKIKPGETIKLDSAGIRLYETIYKDSGKGTTHEVKYRGVTRSRDKLIGVWVKLLRNGKVVSEYASDPDMKKENWPF